MRFFRLTRQGCGSRLVADTDDGLYDLTSAHESLGSFNDLARAASISGVSIDSVARRNLDGAEELTDGQLDGDLDVPLEPGEVWAAGVTYEISEEARKAESGMADIYVDVYDAKRPEIFFKATADRTVGPGDNIGIRGDSNWNVPEPEVSIVLYRGEAVGYTIGNDVSSRDIEGANPLYLPQAKVFDRCCALGPAVVSHESIDDPSDLAISMEILRDDETVFRDTTSTSEMVRSYEDLTAYLNMHNSIPETAVLMTGTSLVPPDEFTLREGDRVEIHVEKLGTLVNEVVVV